MLFRSNGKKFKRIPNENSENCHDCGAKPGLLHHWKCDNETCPKCKGQALGCECNGDYELVIEEKVPTYTDKNYVKKFLWRKTDNDLLMLYNAPSQPKEWKDIYVKELINRGINPAIDFENAYDKYSTGLLEEHLKTEKNQDVRFFIQQSLDKRKRTAKDAENELPLYIVMNDTDENDFDLQFCLEKTPRLDLLKNLGLCLDYDAFPFVLAIIDKEGNVDSFTDNIEGLNLCQSE